MKSGILSRGRWLVSALYLCMGVGCGEPPAPSVEIGFAGSTFAAPLFESWVESYRVKRPDVNLTYQAVGSSEGVRRFLDESIDIGASDSALTDDQIAQVKRGAALIPVTAGTVTLAYNPESLPREGLKLSRAAYVDIFLGKITNWNDPRLAALNPGIDFPDLPITVVVRSDGSGTTFAFTNHLSAISDEWKAGPGVGRSVPWPKVDRSVPGNERVAREVQLKAGAISYLECGIASRSGLGMALLENKSGAYVEATGHSGLETLLDAELPPNLRAFFPDPASPEAYPIVTFTWLLVFEKYPAPERARVVKDFVRWCLKEGQSKNEGLGYIRLSPRIIKAALAAVDAIQEH